MDGRMDRRMDDCITCNLIKVYIYITKNLDDQSAVQNFYYKALQMN